MEDMEDMSGLGASSACDFGRTAKIRSIDSATMEAMPPCMDELSGKRTGKECKWTRVDNAVCRVMEDMEDISSIESSVSNVYAICESSIEVPNGCSILHILHRLGAA